MVAMKDEQVGTDGQDDVQKKFDIAVKLVKSLPQSASFQPSYSEATKIYSYFKQSKFGPCTNARPGFWDVVNRAKWDAWSALGNMPQEVAMKNYVEEIKKVYYRIKDIDAFEEKHTEFADVLIPFCQLTGTQLTNKLIEIVKEKRLGEEKKPIQMNGHAVVNGGGCDAVGLQNGIDHEDEATSNMSTKIPITKNVKFHISDEDVEDDNRSSLEEENPVANMYVEGGSSGNDSDDEEIYCDSIDPDQINGVANALVKSDQDIHLPIVQTETSLFTPALPTGIKTEAALFSPVTPNGYPTAANFTGTNCPPVTPNGYLTAANFTGTNCNSSNNGFEMEGVNGGGKHLQSVRKRDDVLHTCCVAKKLQKPFDRKNSHRKTSSQDFLGRSTSPRNIFENPCNCGVRTRKRQGQQTGQYHANQRHTNQAQHNDGRTNGNGSGLNGQSSTSNHSHHSHRGHSGGSNNGGSDDGSYTSTSSSSSDNVGLKIVKALERMDDNMHLILKRLDSIDISMQTLAAPPETPWWIKMMPSKFIVMSTMWPIIVNLLFYYFWRRRRKYQLRKLKSSI